MGYFSRIGPAAAALREMDDAAHGETLAAIRQVVEHNHRDGLVAMRAACWIVTARRT
jgi:hypothetical protein